jgi:tetratricopeptide (TPR) repeat protein
MPPKDIQTHLLGLIKKSHRLELEYLNSLSDGARNSVGTFEEWAPKDRISHNTYWRRRCVESLSYISRDQKPPEYPPYEECNRQNFEETRELSVHVLLREADLVLTAIPMVLERFTEEEFRKFGFTPHIKNNTLLGYTIHNCYFHPLYHISEAYLRLGNLSQVDAIQDLVMKDISGIDDTPFSLGTVYYDRSCFYAMAGDSAQALEYLQKSLGLRPDLAAWAREDSDLISLREDARFIELVANNQDPAAVD